MKRILIPSLLAAAAIALTGCAGPFHNPGDFLGGGGTGEIAEEADDSLLERVKEGLPRADFASLSESVSEERANPVEQNAGTVEISESGTYLFRGEYGGIRLCKEDLTVHFVFDDAAIRADLGPAIDGTAAKGVSLTITLQAGSENFVEADFEQADAIVIDGDLFLNGSGYLSADSGDGCAVSVTGGLTAVDCTLDLNAKEHAFKARSVSACDCVLNVLSAGEDGIHAERRNPNAEPLSEGFVLMRDVKFTCTVAGNGIRAESAVFLERGTVSIKTEGLFVRDTEKNRNDYGLSQEDFRFVKHGDRFLKVSSEYQGCDSMYALVCSCKGIYAGSGPEEKLGGAAADEAHAVLFEAGIYEIDSSDDAVHIDDGGVSLCGGSLRIATSGDAVVAGDLVKIKEGKLVTESSYDGIKCAFLDVSGGEIEVDSANDGISAFGPKDAPEKGHVLIGGGEVTVSADGAALYTSGSFLMTEGITYLAGATTSTHGSVDSELGIVVNGGIFLASGALGMVETPAVNSRQRVISYARSSPIAAGTNFSLTYGDGTLVFSCGLLKNGQSFLISCPEIEEGKTFRIYGGDSKLCELKISGWITKGGSSTGISSPGASPDGSRGPGLGFHR